MELGKFGVWTSYHAIGEDNAGEAAKLVEDVGFGTFWLGEGAGLVREQSDLALSSVDGPGPARVNLV